MQVATITRRLTVLTFEEQMQLLQSTFVLQHCPLSSVPEGFPGIPLPMPRPRRTGHSSLIHSVQKRQS